LASSSTTAWTKKVFFDILRQDGYPMSYYREMVKDMDDSQKLELVSILIQSVKPIQTRTLPDMPLEEDL